MAGFPVFPDLKLTLSCLLGITCVNIPVYSVYCGLILKQTEQIYWNRNGIGKYLNPGTGIRSQKCGLVHPYFTILKWFESCTESTNTNQ